MNTQADLQRWSDDVARDPRSLAFLPLAKAYRRQGLVQTALQLCLRGLEHHPANVEAHGLLAVLHLEQGDRQKAADEWSIVLRIDPQNFDALRGLGFCYLERDQLTRARQMLERAAALRPGDGTVREALELLGARNDQEQRREQRSDPLPSDDPWAEAKRLAGAVAVSVNAVVEPVFEYEESPRAVFELAEEAIVETSPAAPPRRRAPETVTEPAALFDELLGSGPLLGALLVDVHGLVHAGRLTEEAAGDAELIGAVMGGSVEEATRTAQYLAIGNWRGVMLEAERALLQLTPVGAQAVVVLAARRSTPAGWLMRAGAQAAERAAAYMETYG
jgi:predicted regulator of Ras-like GTPase activity (Roadblock/LC7/MglB family)